MIVLPTVLSTASSSEPWNTTLEHHINKTLDRTSVSLTSSSRIRREVALWKTASRAEVITGEDWQPWPSPWTEIHSQRQYLHRTSMYQPCVNSQLAFFIGIIMTSISLGRRYSSSHVLEIEHKSINNIVWIFTRDIPRDWHDLSYRLTTDPIPKDYLDSRKSPGIQLKCKWNPNSALALLRWKQLASLIINAVEILLGKKTS